MHWKRDWTAREFLRRRWRRVLLFAVGVPVLVLLLVTGVFVAIDYDCLRSSGSVTKKLVERFDADVAHGRFADACATLTSRARRRFMAEASQQTCAAALETLSQGALPSPPGAILAVRTNSDESHGVVRTSAGVYRLEKPEDSPCSEWRIARVRTSD